MSNIEHWYVRNPKRLEKLQEAAKEVAQSLCGKGFNVREIKLILERAITEINQTQVDKFIYPEKL